MSPRELDQFGVHVLLVVSGVFALLLPVGPTTGWRIAIVLVAYHLATGLVAWQRGHVEWLRVWAFSLTVGLFQVLPDAVLVHGLQTLRFTGGEVRVLGVPWYLPLMWPVAFVIVVAVADGVERRRGPRAGWLAGGTTGLAVFVAAEAAMPLLSVWEHVGVRTLGPVGVYIVPAQLVLSLLVLACARWVRGLGVWRGLLMAAVVSLAFTGAAVCSWLLIDGL